MTPIALADLMLSLSAELARLADATEGLHDVICAGGASGTEFLRRAQGVDHTTQLLADLALFCANLAAETPAGWSLDAGPALAQLRLAELRPRIAPGAKHPAHSPPLSDGALELF